jgi:Na+/proline symporter
VTQSPLTALAALVLLAAYLAVMLALGRRRTHHLDAEGFVVADRDVGLLSGTASMGATWIWAASVFAAATAAYTYGPSGAFHYAFWGGLALLFVWRYGRRVRQLAPHGHTLSEFVRARHGRLSQGVMALEGYLNSQYSLVVNFTAAGALLSLLSPVSYQVAVIVVAVGVVAYTSLSGIRASITTDLVQMGAIALLAVVLVPLALAGAGGPGPVEAGLDRLGERGQWVSMEAFLGQGAPMMALVLAYAFANPTVWQRVWTVRASQLRAIYVRSGLLYIAVVFSLGTLGLLALATGVEPVDGDLNTLIPAVIGAYLPGWLAATVMLLILAAVTSTADSDLSALSSMAVADLWHGHVDAHASPGRLLAVGRVSMVVVAAIGAAVALLRIDILTLVLFYGMIRAASVFPIAASIAWQRVSNAGFAAGVVGGIGAGIAARVVAGAGGDAAGAAPGSLLLGVPLVLVAAVGAGTMAGCVAFPFARPRGALWLGVAVAGAIAVLHTVWLPGLLAYPVLLSTLVALGAGMLVCVGVSLAGSHRFEWDELAGHVHPLTAAKVR